ncbi:MAG: rhodanese protein [Bacteroidetes bacterium]|nr:rhodanese protein [Bacteroidota bacterium]
MSFNKILASIALILALLAAFIGIPRRDVRNLDEIAILIETGKDHITPLELAEQIHTGKKIRLIDLRDSVSHFHQHIVHSEIMSVQQLLNNGIKRNEIVVLYSEGGIHASQAWMLLKMKHYDSVYTLLGGFSGWKEEILYPTLHAGATEEKKDVERRKTLSLFFGGEPTVISQETSKKKSVRQHQSPQKQNPPVKAKKGEELRYQC